MVAYTDLAAARTRAKERSGADSTQDTYLTELLNLSAGTDPNNTTHYRPFYVAAKWLQQDRGQQTLKKAKDGIEFTGLAVPIASLLDLQAAYDLANGLTIPPGFEAIPPDEAATATTPVRQFRTTSMVNRIRP